MIRIKVRHLRRVTHWILAILLSLPMVLSVAIVITCVWVMSGAVQAQKFVKLLHDFFHERSEELEGKLQ